jgi:epoxide hydrolase-like predicted phosphatase
VASVSDSAAAVQDARPHAQQAPRRGLLVDWGGVLTSNVFEAFASFCRTEGLKLDALRTLFRASAEARDALIELETGAIDEPEFEQRFARLLSLEPAAGLTDRLWADVAPDERMIAAVARARAAGIRTALVSNSWGTQRYDADMLARLFDATVISAVERTRKPDPRMYELGCERLALPPAECVLVDDLSFNLPPAQELGIATVLHRSASETIPQLERLLGVQLSDPDPPA